MPGAPLPQPPDLKTLNKKPTWVNRAGRVDRSACMEIRASEVRKGVIFRIAPRTNDPAKPIMYADVRIAAPLIAHLHALRQPFALSGDKRTQKSNAMKDHRYPVDMNALHNPNKGAARTKYLALNAEGHFAGVWEQTVRIERHDRTRKKSHKGPPTHQHFLICPQCAKKYVKLFLIVCSEAEAHDAELAEGWVKLLDARAAAARQSLPAELMQHRAKLIERYGLLFYGRRLLCRTCLGLRYGEAKRQHVETSQRQQDREYHTNLPR